MVRRRGKTKPSKNYVYFHSSCPNENKFTQHKGNPKRKWVDIAKLIPGTTNIQCQQKWEQLDARRGPWTNEVAVYLIHYLVCISITLYSIYNVYYCTRQEDEALKTAVTIVNTTTITTFNNFWVTVAKQHPHLAGRTSKQCRERYVNSLDPNINTGPWTEEEERYVIRERKLGRSWSEMKMNLPGRPANSIKNYWNYNLSRREGVDDSVEQIEVIDAVADDQTAGIDEVNNDMDQETYLYDYGE